MRRFQHTATRRWLLDTRILTISAAFVSTHSHPKVAAGAWMFVGRPMFVSTHSHPKVAATAYLLIVQRLMLFQHTATRRWLLRSGIISKTFFAFQHTATRRWLQIQPHRLTVTASFNTQPPEGGCLFCFLIHDLIELVSTHSHPKVAAFANIAK